MSYSSTISNEEVTALELGHLSGEILVVDTPEAMHKADKILQSATILGFDTETRPSFSKKVHHTISLLQLSTSEVSMLFRLKYCELSPTVVSVLESPEVLKIGAAIRDDIKALGTVAKFKADGFVDLQSIINKWGIEEKSVRKMAAIVLGFRVSKAQRLSNWDANVLTRAQMEYAAMDAWVCQRMYRVLNGEL